MSSLKHDHSDGDGAGFATKRGRTGRPTRAGAAELEDRLRRAALATFAQHGFDGTSMEAVAAAANISKRTLYAKYPDKRTLLAEVMAWAFSTLRWDQALPAEAATDLHAALLAVGRAAIARVVHPEVAQITRIAMTESHRFPEFAGAAHTMTWSPRLRAVVDLLQQRAQAGEVVVVDFELAAEQFLAMVSGFPALLALFGLHRDRDDEERHLEHAVALFLSGIQPRQG